MKITMYLSALALLAFAVTQLHAQNYSIDWSTLDGGGGMSTGGVFAVSGTMGQADASASTGEPLAVEGGFWSILAAIQGPGAPLLSIMRTRTNNIAISWPALSGGFNLQENPNLSTTNWTNGAIQPITVDGQQQVAVPSLPGNHFYRLKN